MEKLLSYIEYTTRKVRIMEIHAMKIVSSQLHYEILVTFHIDAFYVLQLWNNVSSDECIELVIWRRVLTISITG